MIISLETKAFAHDAWNFIRLVLTYEHTGINRYRKAFEDYIMVVTTKYDEYNNFSYSISMVHKGIPAIEIICSTKHSIGFVEITVLEDALSKKQTVARINALLATSRNDCFKILRNLRFCILPDGMYTFCVVTTTGMDALVLIDSTYQKGLIKVLSTKIHLPE